MASDAHKASGFGQVRETVISLGISLIMAFIAKAYVLEAYVIPTGSMGPTLLGKHMRFDGPQTGYDWPVETWHKGQTNAGPMPYPLQGGTDPAGRPLEPPFVADPMTVGHTEIGPRGLSDRARAGAPSPQTKKTRSGDRILVQKYLYDLFEPTRYDVVVFKNPTQATQNYIKRLIALPGEHVWVLDGDIFTAPAPEGAAPQGYDPARDASWSIQRKPLDQQKRLWQTVFSSEYTPIRPADAVGRAWFQPPWQPTTTGWTFGADGVYEYAGQTPTTIEWDAQAWPIDDWSHFNDFPLHRRNKLNFPVGDVRVRAGAVGSPILTIAVHDEQFRVRFTDSATELQQRSTDADPWVTIATGDAVGGFDKARNYELWFADQALSVVVNGNAVIAQHPIDWSAAERLERSTGLTLEQARGPAATDRLLSPATYTKSTPRVAIGLEGPGTLYRVGLDRDLYYRSAVRNRTGTHPAFGGTPDTVATLGPEHFWLLGDNSTFSLDARAWSLEDPAGRIDPYVADQIDPTVGVVHRDLLLGKAFFVYWPAVYSASDSFFIPVPDFGRMRFID